MHRAVRLIALVLTLSVLPQPGHAGTVGWTWAIMPIASTRIESHRETRLMLCKVVPNLRVAGLPFWPGQPKFVLAKQCAGTDRVAPITSDALRASRDAGLVPASVSTVPRRSPADWLSGTWGWAFVAAFVSLLSVMQRGRRRVARFATLSV